MTDLSPYNFSFSKAVGVAHIVTARRLSSPISHHPDIIIRQNYRTYCVRLDFILVVVEF